MNRRYQCLIFLAFVLVLCTGCSMSTPVQATPATRLPTVLHIFRPATTSYPAFEYTSQDTPEIQRFYRMAYTLTKLEARKMHCPLDTGIGVYQLDFRLHDSSLQKMMLHDSGCRSLSRSGSTYIVSTAFRSLFLKIANIPTVEPTK
jgi:hypothetical protein